MSFVVATRRHPFFARHKNCLVEKGAQIVSSTPLPVIQASFCRAWKHTTTAGNLARFLIWQIGEFEENCESYNSPNIAVLHSTHANGIGRRKI